MKKILAILLAALMMLSITACSTKGTIWELIGNLSGENGTYEAESSDIEWPWDWTLPGESETETETPIDEVYVGNFKGDWHGYMFWSNATGRYEVNNNIYVEMIARFVFDAAEGVTPFLAIAIDDNSYNYKYMSATKVDSQTMSLDGVFFFVNCDNIKFSANGNGSLKMTQHLDDGSGNSIDIVACLRRIGDNSWNDSVDYPCFPKEYVEYYKDKSFDEIALSYGLDLDTIPKATDSDTPGESESAPGLSDDVTTVQVDYAGHVFISFPKGWSWDDGYDWIRKDNSSIHIGVDTLLGKTNVQEWRDAYSGGSYSSYDNFKLEDITFNGYSGIRCQMEDWLGATINVVLDFGGKIDDAGIYGVKFTISGDNLKDLWNEEIQAILNSLELK